MKKLFGVQVEANITADDGIVKGLGHGIKKGSVPIEKVLNGLVPVIIDSIKDYLETKEKDIKE